MPVVRKEGHLFLECDFAAIHFTKQEPKKFHIHLFQPCPTNLFNLGNCAHPDQASSERQKNLDDTSQASETCQCHLPKAPSFQVSIANEIKFNSVVPLDLMELESRSMLKG